MFLKILCKEGTKAEQGNNLIVRTNGSDRRKKNGKEIHEVIEEAMVMFYEYLFTQFNGVE